MRTLPKTRLVLSSISLLAAAFVPGLRSNRSGLDRQISIRTKATAVSPSAHRRSIHSQ